MAVTPKRPFAQIESDFWSTLTAMMDSLRFARILAPFAFWTFQRVRGLLWVFIVMALASGGLTLGFVAGLLARRLSG